jgi:4-cresol dehydrogenase (hydroxylating)
MVSVAAENEELLDAFRAALGSENVVTDAATRRRYETTTYRTDFRIPAIVLPKSTGEVQACVRIANRFKTPLYPISTGKNYGYGSRVPTADHCVIVELSRMRGILDFNEALGHVTLEPGVTQRQLHEFLRGRNSALWMDATGSCQDHSLIGNLAERGSGHTPYADHFNQTGGMEVVLPNGEVIHTGMGRFANAKAKGIYRWGVGPYLDGLFTQSNLGIITQATIWLMPAPAYHEYVYFSFHRHDQIGEIIDLLRPLRLDGTIKSAVHIANDYKVVSAMQAYPWEQTGGSTPLPKSVMDEAVKAWDCGAWNGYTALCGSWLEVASARRRIKRQLRGKTKRISFLSPWLLKAAELAKQPYRMLTGINLPEMMKSLKPVYELTKGIPTNHFMDSTYWRKKGGVPAQTDPDRDGCGLLWCAPIAPIDGRHAAAIYAIVLPVFARYGFEPMVAITLLTERALSCVISISFDRSVPGEDDKALECHDRLLAELAAAGFYPYRLSTHAMDKLPPSEPAYLDLLKTLKDALDPNGILAPGRYIR